MSRATRRKAVRKIVKDVIKSKEQDVRIELPKESFDYFERKYNEQGRKK